MAVNTTGLLLISNRMINEKQDQPVDNLLFSYTHPHGSVEIDKLKNLAVAVSGAGRASCGQQVHSMLLSRTDSNKKLRISFVHTKDVLFVQLLPGQICSATATAAASWLLHMLLFLLGPWHNWLQDRPNEAAGVQLSPSCAQQLQQLLPVLLLPLQSFALQQPSLIRLLIAVGLPAVQLPQQLQQQIAGKLQALRQLLPAWLPVVLPLQQAQQQQQQQQLLGPSCCLFHRGCLVHSSVRPWLAQRLWGLAWALGLHSRTSHYPPELLLQDAYNNLAVAHGLANNSSSRSASGAHASSSVVVNTCHNCSGWTCATGAAAAGTQSAVHCRVAEGPLPAAWQQQRQRQSLQERLQEQIQVFELPAAAAAPAAGHSTDNAVGMVQPCTIIAACLGPYILMVLAERIPAGAEEHAHTETAAPLAASPSAACTAGQEAANEEGWTSAPAAGAAAGDDSLDCCSTLSAVLACLEQILVSHGEALQQQLQLSSLPAVIATACQCSSSSSTGAQQQPADQQDQRQNIQDKRQLQHNCELGCVAQRLPKLRAAVQEPPHSCPASPAAAPSSCTSPRKTWWLQNLLCGSSEGGVGDEHHHADPAMISSRSAVLSNPGTPTATALRASQRSNSSGFGSSAIKAFQQQLLSRVIGRQPSCYGKPGFSSNRSMHSNSTPSGVLGSPRSGSGAGATSGRGSSSVHRSQSYAAAAAGLHSPGTDCTAGQCLCYNPGAGSTLSQSPGSLDIATQGSGRKRSSLFSRHVQPKEQLPLQPGHCVCCHCGGSSSSVSVRLTLNWEQGTFAVAESLTAAATGTASRQHSSSSAGLGNRSTTSSSLSCCAMDAAAAFISHMQHLALKAALESTPTAFSHQPELHGQASHTAVHIWTAAAATSAAAVGTTRYNTQHAPLLPSWSSLQLEHHAAVAGDGASSAVLDASPEPWRLHGAVQDAVLAGLQQVQLSHPGRP